MSLSYLHKWHQKLPEIVNNFQAGRRKDFVGNWQRLTSDAWILKMIQGIDIEFIDLPFQEALPKCIDFNEEECAIIDNEIHFFWQKGS